MKRNFRKDLIVAKYKEDVSWVHSLKDDYNVVVYNKDNQLEHSNFNKEPEFTVIDGVSYCDVPNVGRESHTYLFHIAKNYEDLADFSVFVQGNPFDHQPRMLEILKHVDEKIYSNFSYKVEQHRHFFQQQLDDESYKRVNFYYGNHLSLYRELFGKDLPERYRVGIHGLFAAPKSHIIRNAKSIYEKCISKFDNNVYLTGFCVTKDGYNPAAMVTQEVLARHGGIPNGEGFGWLFEYFWDLLFHNEEILD